MGERSLISVVVPAWRAEKTLAATLDSILSQTWRELEVLVVDDASPDGTLALAQSYAAKDPRVRVIAQPENGGVSKARNRGVREARGGWIAFLDSDDLWMPEKLERQMTLAAQHPEAGLFFTGSAFISEDDHKYGYTLSVPERVNYRRLLGQNVISCSSVLVRRELMERYPMGNDAIHEDFAVWLKILREEPWAYGVNEPLLVYRVSRSSKSGNKLKAARMTFGTYRYVRVPLPLAVWSGVLYTVRGIRKFRAIGASLTDETFALPASEAGSETE